VTVARTVPPSGDPTLNKIEEKKKFLECWPLVGGGKSSLLLGENRADAVLLARRPVRVVKERRRCGTALNDGGRRPTSYVFCSRGATEKPPGS